MLRLLATCHLPVTPIKNPSPIHVWESEGINVWVPHWQTSWDWRYPRCRMELSWLPAVAARDLPEILDIPKTADIIQHLWVLCAVSFPTQHLSVSVCMYVSENWVHIQWCFTMFPSAFSNQPILRARLHQKLWPVMHSQFLAVSTSVQGFHDENP